MMLTNGTIDLHHARVASAAASAVVGATMTGKGAVGAVEGSSEDAITGATLTGGSLRREVDSGADVRYDDYKGCSPFCCIRKHFKVCAVRCFHRALERLPCTVRHVRGSQLHSR